MSTSHCQVGFLGNLSYFRSRCLSSFSDIGKYWMISSNSALFHWLLLWIIVCTFNKDCNVQQYQLCLISFAMSGFSFYIDRITDFFFRVVSYSMISTLECRECIYNNQGNVKHVVSQESVKPQPPLLPLLRLSQQQPHLQQQLLCSQLGQRWPHSLLWQKQNPFWLL